ncbi:hypothetical protein [Lysobacter terrae]
MWLLLATSGVANAQSQSDALSSPSSDVRRQFSEDVYGSGIANKAVYGAIATLVRAQLQSLEKGDPRVDEVDWHLLALGSSGDKTYLPLLQEATTSKVRSVVRHAREAIEVLSEANEAGRPLLLPEKVLVISEGQSAQCRQLRQYVCEAHGNIAECLDEIRDVAVEGGANSFMVLNQSNSGFGLFQSSQVVANLYACPRQL